MHKELGIPQIRHCLHVLADLEVAAGRGAQGAILHRNQADLRAPIFSR